MQWGEMERDVSACRRESEGVGRALGEQLATFGKRPRTGRHSLGGALQSESTQL
jgi:hypothetical protein